MTTLVQKTDALAECLWTLVDRCNGSIALYQTIIKNNKKVRAYVDDVERAIKGETYGDTFQDQLHDIYSEIDNVKDNYYVVDDEIALVKKILSETRASMQQYIAAVEKTATDGSNVKTGDIRRKKTEKSGRSGRNSSSWWRKLGKMGAVVGMAASTMLSGSPQPDTVNFNSQDNNYNSDFQYNYAWTANADNGGTSANGWANDAGVNHSYVHEDGTEYTYPADGQNDGPTQQDGVDSGGQWADTFGGHDDLSNDPLGSTSGGSNGRPGTDNWADGAGSNGTIANGGGNDAGVNHPYVDEDGTEYRYSGGGQDDGPTQQDGVDSGGQGADTFGGGDDSSDDPLGSNLGGDDGDANSTVGNDNVLEANAGSGGNGETGDAGGDVHRDTTESGSGKNAGEPSNDGSEQPGSAVSTAVDPGGEHRDTTLSGGTTFQSFVPDWFSSWARSNGGDGRGGSGASKKDGGVSERTDATEFVNKLVHAGTSYINDNIRVVADAANAAKETVADVANAAKETVANAANAVFGRNDPNVQNLEKILLGNWRIEATDDYCRGLMQKIVDNNPDGAHKYLKDLKERMITHLREECAKLLWMPQSMIDIHIEKRTRVFDGFIDEEDEAVRDATSQNG